MKYLLNKKIIALVLVSILALSGNIPIHNTESLTNQELKAYYDIVKGFHDLLYKTNSKNDDYEEVCRGVADKYGLTIEQAKTIDDEGFSLEPTDREFDIYDELFAKLDKLPENASKEESESIHQEIANKYGLSILELYDVEYRVSFGFSYF